MECEIGDFKCLGLSLLGKLVPYLGEPFVWALMGLLLASTWLVRKLVRREWELLGKPGNDAFRRKVAKLMVKRPLAGHYLGGVQWLLRVIDYLFGPVSNNQNPGGWVDRLFGCQPWTAVSYERLLNLAFVYPVVFLLFGFLLAEVNLRVAISTLLITILAYAGGLWMRYYWLNTKVKGAWLRSLLIFLFAVVAIALVAVPVAGDFAVFVVGVAVAAAAVAAAGAAAGVAGVGAIGVVVGFSAVTIAFVDEIFGGTTSAIATSAAIAISIAVAIILSFVTLSPLVFLRYRFAPENLATFWCIASPIHLLVAIGLSALSKDSGLLVFMLFMAFLPLVNAPIDWLSLGVTRGLLNRIADGTHSSWSTFLWALADVVIALFFLLLVALVSWSALSLANSFAAPASSSPILNGPLISADQLREIIIGNDTLSIGVWMILASTLIPTFLHFLVALLACVTLPFNSRNFRKTTVKLRKARREAVRRVKTDANQAADAVPVHEYARGWAMVYFFVSWPMVFVVWLVLVSVISYATFLGLSWMFQWFLL